MAHIFGFERSQLLLLPETVDDYVGSDNPVRFIDAFVDQLDLAAAGFIRVAPKATGRPGYAPGDLFDVPRDGAMGLVWWLKSRTVTALGPEHAGVGQPAYDRVTRREWANPYARPVRPVSLSPILEHQQKIMQRVLG